MKSIIEFIFENKKDFIYKERAEVFIFNDEGKVYFGFNGRNPLSISIPGGEVEPGETPEDAAIRETREEIGVVPKNLKYFGEDYYTYSDSARRFIPDWNQKYDGLHTTSFIGEFDKKDKSIYGTAGDSSIPKYLDIDEAIQLFKQKKAWKHNDYHDNVIDSKIRTLTKLKNSKYAKRI